MTITEAPISTTTVASEAEALVAVTFDLYRDIHKAIRSELFAVTGDAGRLDPGDREARTALAANVHDVVDLLVAHAEHEDGAIQPVLESQLPALAATVAGDHAALDARMDHLRFLADAAAQPTVAGPTHLVHRTYLALASFTSDYLRHQDVEERVVMPALEAAVGVEAVIGIHGAILGAIPPEEMARSLAIMLPAMNVENRTELLGGMRANAPAEAFQGVWGLAHSVLEPADVAALANRLGIC